MAQEGKWLGWEAKPPVLVLILTPRVCRWAAPCPPFTTPFCTHSPDPSLSLPGTHECLSLVLGPILLNQARPLTGGRWPRSSVESTAVDGGFRLLDLRPDIPLNPISLGPPRWLFLIPGF